MHRGAMLRTYPLSAMANGSCAVKLLNPTIDIGNNIVMRASLSSLICFMCSQLDLKTAASCFRIVVSFTELKSFFL